MSLQLAGACSQQQQAMQVSMDEHNYRSPKQNPDPAEQQKQLLPVTVMTTCCMQHTPSSLSFSQASSSVKPVLKLVSKPLAKAQSLLQCTQDKVLLEGAFPEPLKGQPARIASQAARHFLRALSLKPVCSGPWHQPAAAWLPGRSPQPKARPQSSLMLTVMRSTGLALQPELLGPGHRFR